MNSSQKQFQPFVMAEERAARSVFVGNIPYEATEEQLKEIFCQAGPVVSFRLVYDRETGKPKGYGFCEYQDLETAQSAMRNLNNHDFNGRPLRVGVAAGESTKDEARAMLGGPPVESPYGEPVEPEKAPEAVARAVASLPPEQMFELMKQMKLCILNNPNEARNMLLQNPQLAYALLQAQIVMKIVDPQVALAMLHRQTEQIPPMMPSGGQPVQPQQAPAAATMPGQLQPTSGLGPSVAGPVMPQQLGPGPAGPQAIGFGLPGAGPARLPEPSASLGPSMQPGVMRPAGPGSDFGPRGPSAGTRGGLLGDMPTRDVDHREMIGGPMDRRDFPGGGPMDMPRPMDRRDMGPQMDIDRRDLGPMDRPLGPPMDRRDMPGPMDRRDFGPPVDRRDLGPMDIDRRDIDHRDIGPPMDRRDMMPLGPMDRRDMSGPRDPRDIDRREMGPRGPMGMMGDRGAARPEMMGMGPGPRFGDPGPRFGEPDMGRGIGPGPVRPGMGPRPDLGRMGPRPDLGPAVGRGMRPDMEMGMGPRMEMGPGPRGPIPDVRDPRQVADLRDPRQAADLRRALGPLGPQRPAQAPPTSSPSSGASQQDQEKAALIMQVLQLSDEQIAMLPADQRESILILKEQIARSAAATS